MEGEGVGDDTAVWANNAARAYTENRDGVLLVRPLRVTVGSEGGEAWRAGSAKVTAGGSRIGGGISISEMEKSISSGGVDVLSTSETQGSRKAGGSAVAGAMGGGVG